MDTTILLGALIDALRPRVHLQCPEMCSTGCVYLLVVSVEPRSQCDDVSDRVRWSVRFEVAAPLPS